MRFVKIPAGLSTAGADLASTFKEGGFQLHLAVKSHYGGNTVKQMK